jgi:hypothetical protein
MVVVVVVVVVMPGSIARMPKRPDGFEKTYICLCFNFFFMASLPFFCFFFNKTAS